MYIPCNQQFSYFHYVHALIVVSIIFIFIPIFFSFLLYIIFEFHWLHLNLCSKNYWSHKMYVGLSNLVINEINVDTAHFIYMCYVYIAGCFMIINIY